jgi:outer membrane protein OmpA-like peptidoglycan-associated protein
MRSVEEHAVKHVKTIVLAVAGTVLAAACASTPERLEQVEQARTEVQTLAQDPMSQNVASRELANARQSLGDADTALKEGRVEQAKHYAYIATQQAKTGQERISEAKYRAQIAQGESERNRVLLEARTRQAQAQAQKAEAARQEAESARAELADMKAKQTERGMVLTLGGGVLFETSKATLKPGAANQMDRIAQFMQENPGTKVIVEGHTDNTGSEEYNEELSQRRAQAVADALAERGVDPSRVQAVGRGEAYPVASNNTSAGRQQNRRVDIVFSDEEGRFASGTTGTLR